MQIVDTIGFPDKKTLDTVRNSIENFDSVLNPDGIKILFESPVIANDVKKLLENANFNVEISDDDGRISLNGKLKNIPSVVVPVVKDINQDNQDNANDVPEKNQVNEIKTKSTLGYLFSNQNFSRNKNYGTIFLTRTLKAIANSKNKPDVIALVNDSVKLALYNATTCDFLKMLERKGTRILVSGMCSDNFGITETIGAGVISDIDEIIQVISSCDRIINL